MIDYLQNKIDIIYIYQIEQATTLLNNQEIEI